MSETTKSKKNLSNRTQLLPPRDAIEIAWARTDELSTNKEIQMNAERVKKRIDDIIAIAERGSNEKEKKYVSSVYTAIESTYRNLITIVNGRNNNYDEIRKLRQQQSENIQSLATFSFNLQSALPRVAEMTIGGITIGTLFSPYFEKLIPSLGSSAFLIILALGAAISYGVSEIIINPYIAKRKQIETIKLDYEIDLYYQQYIKRSKLALIALYNEVERLHETYFGKKYNEDIKDISEVNNLLCGINTTMCKYVSTCLKKKRITPNNWTICESGETIDKCRHFKSYSN